jgi:hypothetical protein
VEWQAVKDIERRTLATIKTQERFADKPFDLSGTGTCIHLVRFHAKAMGRTFPTVPRFRGVHGARRALKEAGYANLIEVMDSQFERIPAAFAYIGDVVAFPGFDEFEAFTIRGDVNKFLGWHEDAKGCTVIECNLGDAIGAWRL